jgi:hypothetical protein
MGLDKESRKMSKAKSQTMLGDIDIEVTLIVIKVTG